MGDMCKDWKDIQECMTKKLDRYVEFEGDNVDPDAFEKITNGIHYLGEAIYYDTVTEAMTDVSDEERMRKRSSKWGYVEPKWDIDTRNATIPDYGMRNDKMGYKPYLDQEPYVYDYISDYGREYDDWKDAKRHYTETHSIDDKKKMDEKTLNHIDNFVMTFKEMWKDANPDVRHDMKDELTEIMEMLKSA